MNFAILRTEKLKTFGNIAASASHTFRERETLNANPELTPLNLHNGATSSEEILTKVKKLLPKKMRSNGVLCIEYLITASPDFFGNGKQNLDYFENAREWLVKKHGEQNIIYSGIQLDEKTPHMVAYVLPIDEKGKLNARQFLGGRQKLSAMQTSFSEEVGEKFGLDRGIKGSTAKHERVKKFYGNLEKNIAVTAENTKNERLKSYNLERHFSKLSNEKEAEINNNAKNKMDAFDKKMALFNQELAYLMKENNRFVVLHGLENLQEKARNLEQNVEAEKEKWQSNISSNFDSEM